MIDIYMSEANSQLADMEDMFTAIAFMFGGFVFFGGLFMLSALPIIPLGSK